MDKKETLKLVVSDAWYTLVEFEKIFGRNSREYERARTKWVALDIAWSIMFPGELY